MSKLSALGQSAAALFSPEGERLRASQEKKSSNAPANQPVKVPGAKKLDGGQKMQDSLGDSATPGYESFGKKKKGDGKKENGSQKEGSISVPEERENIIRLQVGWEKLLLAQKKICEKAKMLIMSLEAPPIYALARKGKGQQLKVRGCILDLESKKFAQEGAKEEEDEEKEAA